MGHQKYMKLLYRYIRHLWRKSL